MDEKTVFKVRLDEVENKIMFIMKKITNLQNDIDQIKQGDQTEEEGGTTVPGSDTTITI